jgi:uncharacterized protein YprB with RNaseH-like and TPR domain
MLLCLRELIDEADMVVAHNGAKFDLKMICGEMMKMQIPPPSEYRMIDTLKLSKKYTNLPYHNLGYLCDIFNTKYKKMDHGQGVELWHKFMDECPKARKTMEKYNRYDVLCLEELYINTFEGWDRPTNNWIKKQLARKEKLNYSPVKR